MFRGAKCLVSCSAVTIFKFLITFEQGPHISTFSLGSENYITGPIQRLSWVFIFLLINSIWLNWSHIFWNPFFTWLHDHHTLDSSTSLPLLPGLSLSSSLLKCWVSQSSDLSVLNLPSFSEWLHLVTWHQIAFKY